MRQFHPNTYKIEECRRIQNQQKCTKGRYCSFNHLNHEYNKIEEHLTRLRQELLRSHEVMSKSNIHFIVYCTLSLLHLGFFFFVATLISIGFALFFRETASAIEIVKRRRDP